MIACQCLSIEHFSQRLLWDYLIVQYSRGRKQVSAPKPKSVSSGSAVELSPKSTLTHWRTKLGRVIRIFASETYNMYHVIYIYTSSCGVYCDICPFQTTKSDTSRCWCNTLKSLEIDYVNSVSMLDTQRYERVMDDLETDCVVFDFAVVYK